MLKAFLVPVTAENRAGAQMSLRPVNPWLTGDMSWCHSTNAHKHIEKLKRLYIDDMNVYVKVNL